MENILIRPSRDASETTVVIVGSGTNTMENIYVACQNCGLTLRTDIMPFKPLEGGQPIHCMAICGRNTGPVSNMVCQFTIRTENDRYHTPLRSLLVHEQLPTPGYICVARRAKRFLRNLLWGCTEVLPVQIGRLGFAHSRSKEKCP